MGTELNIFLFEIVAFHISVVSFSVSLGEIPLHDNIHARYARRLCDVLAYLDLCGVCAYHFLLFCGWQTDFTHTNQLHTNTHTTIFLFITHLESSKLTL